LTLVKAKSWTVFSTENKMSQKVNLNICDWLGADAVVPWGERTA
jgi:hypothetical protein